MENLAQLSRIDYRMIAENYFEKLYWNDGSAVIGIDEVGRGPLAGPVIAAAVILHKNSHCQLIRDSKLLSESQRLKAYDWIEKNGSWAIGVVDHGFIDKYSITVATEFAMKRALILLLQKMQSQSCALIIDSVLLNVQSFFQGPIHVFYKAESKSISVAAASIIAKVYRDRLMNKYDSVIGGQYNFGTHKGYGTKKHYNAIDLEGISLIHRKSFLKRYCSEFM